MGKKLYIETQGCQMNEYDSARLADLLQEREQLERTDDPREADILLLNTCSIREKAQEKVFSELGRWRQLKEQRPHLIIGVGRCVASQEGEDLLKRAPFVDLIFGPQTLHRVPDMMQQRRQARLPVVDVSFPTIEKFDHLPEPRVESGKAFVSIMEGCSKYCSFCVVPYTRGEEVSRPFDDVIAEVAHLLAQGVVEITLLGQNVNGYRGREHDGGTVSFASLLEHLATLPGLLRLRYTTSHPLEFSDELIECYRHLPQLVSHVHLPVQSGSDRILAAMKRNHDRADYLRRIARLRAIRPDLHLSSDFIVGFPGESEEDFQATLDLIRVADMDHSYSFIYSARPGTPAADLVDDTPLTVKKERLQRLKDLISASTLDKTRAMVGSRQKILVESPSTRYPGHWVGSTFNQRIVHFAATETDLAGRLVEVEISAALTINALRGERCDLHS